MYSAATDRWLWPTVRAHRASRRGQEEFREKRSRCETLGIRPDVLPKSCAPRAAHFQVAERDAHGVTAAFRSTCLYEEVGARTCVYGFHALLCIPCTVGIEC